MTQVQQVKIGTLLGKPVPMINSVTGAKLQLHAEIILFPYICGKDKGIAFTKKN